KGRNELIGPALARGSRRRPDRVAVAQRHVAESGHSASDDELGAAADEEGAGPRGTSARNSRTRSANASPRSIVSECDTSGQTTMGTYDTPDAIRSADSRTDD